MEIYSYSHQGDLQDKVIELSARLQDVTEQKDILKNKLNKSQVEALALSRSYHSELENQSQKYEERQVELHCVIAELSRKLSEAQQKVIAEESEVESSVTREESEMSNTFSSEFTRYSEESVSLSEMSLPPPHTSMEKTIMTKCQPAVNISKVEYCPLKTVDLSRVEYSPLPYRMDSSRVDYSPLHNTDIDTLKSLMQENVELKKEIDRLEEIVEAQVHDLSESRCTLSAVLEEKEELRLRIGELEQQVGGGWMEERIHMVELNEVSPVCKVAEKKKLKRFDSGGNQQVTGSDLYNVENINCVVVEHLVQDIQDRSSIQEFDQVINSPRLGRKALDHKLKEFDIEMERLSSKIEYLRSQNDILSLTLKDSKDHCDQVTVLIGKYESNSTALGLSLSYSDRLIESYDVLVALLETQLGVLLAHCRELGYTEIVGEGNSEVSLVDKAEENWRDALNIASKLLTRLDIDSRPDSGLANTGFTPTWQDDSSSGCSRGSGGSQCSHTPSSHTSSRDTKGREGHKEDRERLNWGKEEGRIRKHISQLKKQKAVVGATVAELESLYPDKCPRQNLGQAKTVDLEMAVLVQELMAMKEEKADIRQKLYLSEKEKSSLELRVNGFKEEERALKSQVSLLLAELREKDQQEQEEPGEEREEQMRRRIMELLHTLEKIKRNSELQQQEATETLEELRKVNSLQSESLEQMKRQYEYRLKVLEQQLLQFAMSKHLEKNHPEKEYKAKELFNLSDSE